MAIIWSDNPKIEDVASTKRESFALLQEFMTSNRDKLTFGDVCQAVAVRAIRKSGSITIDEIQSINRCLDNTVASADSDLTRTETTH